MAKKKEMQERKPEEPVVPPKESYYEWVVAHDLLSLLEPLWQSGGWVLRADGKLHFPLNSMAINTPWRHIQQAHFLDCSTWHRLIFDQIVRKLPAKDRFVPSGCMECFKVVVRPKTVKQLFALEELEKRLKRPSKCGIEVRSTVHGLYGGYFYCKGLAEGLERYKEVRKAVDDDKHLGPDVPVILKRSCTEMELECGPSDQWQPSELGRKFEALVDRWVAKDDFNYGQQPDWLVWRIHRQWIEFAYQHGDSSYSELTNGKPLYPPYVAYHHLAEEQLTPSPDKGVAEKAAED